MSKICLIGHTGFVGGSLQRQVKFEAGFNSKNISEIEGKNFDVVVCCGAPAQKWIANKDPKADFDNIEMLKYYLGKVRCDRVILISTVDVFANPNLVNEDSKVEVDGLHPYGTNRLTLENFVSDNFSDSLIVRLPGLVGPDLRKNVLYDLKNNNCLDKIDRRNIYQYYPMVNLWSDIKIALRNRLELVHFTSEPISTSEVIEDCFWRHANLNNSFEGPSVFYDFRTKYASLFGSCSDYNYSRREVMIAIKSYAQSK